MPITIPAPSTKPTLKCESLAAVQFSLEQRRWIEKNFLHPRENIEGWLRQVTRAVAISELLYHESMSSWPLFEGVRVHRKVTLQPGPATEKRKTGEPRLSWIFHRDRGSSYERYTNFRRFLDNTRRVLNKDDKAKSLVDYWTGQFYDQLATQKFIPHPVCLTNAGRELQQLAAGFMIPVEDSVEGITHALQAQALVQKSGAGTSLSFDRLRPHGSPIQLTSGSASGVVNFLQVFDKMAHVVHQGTQIPGANMAFLPCWHPEIREFIELKKQTPPLQSFQLTVALDTNFLMAVESDAPYDLHHPKTKEVEATISARGLMESLLETGWKAGNISFIFMDRIQDSILDVNPLAGRIQALSSEQFQVLYPHEPLHSGVINVSLFVREKDGNPELDWDSLKKSVHVAVRFLDNTIDATDYPMPEMEEQAKNIRRIGLGLCGWAELLIHLNLPYTSNEAIDFAKKLISFIRDESMAASEDLANERGVFPLWKTSIYDSTSPWYQKKTKYPRNGNTVSLGVFTATTDLTGMHSSGIEPLRGILRKSRDPVSHDVWHSQFYSVAKKQKFFGRDENILMKEIRDNGNSIKGLRDIPADIQKLFVVGPDLRSEDLIRMQMTFQKELDSIVPVPIQFTESASLSDVHNAFDCAVASGSKVFQFNRRGNLPKQILKLAHPSVEA